MHAGIQRIGQKWEGGLYAGSLHFRVTTITTVEYNVVVWWTKLEKNDKVRHNNIIMTQIASLLAVATVFIGLWTLFTSQGGGGRNRGYGSQKTVEKIRT